MKLLEQFKLISRIGLLIYLGAVFTLCLINMESVAELPKDFLGIPLDKWAHFIMFLPYPILIYGSFHGITSRPYGHITMLGIIIFSGILLAGGIEILQGMTEYRSMEIFDLAADLLGLFASSFLILCASAIYNKW